MISKIYPLLALLTLLTTQNTFAQLNQEEWRTIRERWEQASPEERLRLRPLFQEKMNQWSNQLPAPAQAAIGLSFPSTDNNRRNNENASEGSMGFGFGFEKRRFDENH